MRAADRGSLWRAGWRVAVAAAFGLGCLAWLRETGGLWALSARLGHWAPLLSLALHVAIELTPFGNAIPFGVANGSVYGAWGGALLSWLGWMIATLLQHALVRSAAPEVAMRAGLSPGPPGWARRLAESPAILILGRWLPGGAYFVNLGAAALGVPLARQLACAALASAPAALALAALGARLAR